MVDRRTLRLLLPRQLRAMPADLVAIVGLTVLVNIAVFAPLVRETPIRIPLGLVFVLFVPGYAFLAALFPEASDPPVSESTEDDGRGSISTSRQGIDGLERVALSFGLSIAISPLVGLVLNFTPWGIRLTPIMLALTGLTLGLASVATVRRWALPPADRFQIPYRTWIGAARSEFIEPATRADAILNIVLVCSILLAVGSVGVAVMVPTQGEQFSAIYLLTEDDDGELVADGYPTEFVTGQSQDVVVGIDNHEGRSVDYTVVVLEQNVSVANNGTETVVTDQRELDRFETTLAHNDSWHQPYSLEPTMVGEDIRVVWLLYPETVPAEPTMETTDYHVHLWLEVAPADN